MSNDTFIEDWNAARLESEAMQEHKKPIEDTELSWQFLAGVATFALTLALFFWHYS